MDIYEEYSRLLFFLTFFSSRIDIRCKETLRILNDHRYVYKSAEERFLNGSLDFCTFLFFFCFFFVAVETVAKYMLFFAILHIISLYVSYMYTIIRLFVTTLHDDRLYFLRSRTRIIREIKRLDHNDDQTSVACAIQRFASLVTASFEASVLVLDYYRCPHLWPVQ